jgi:predicted ATPase
MATIEGFRVKNYKTLKDITLGRLWNQREISPLTTMTVVIGRNGVGKSTLFDAFGFLSDALRLGVEEACDTRGRGGFKRIRSQGQSGPIEFEIYYKQDNNARPITYELAIDLDVKGRPYVSRERLRQRRAGQSRGRPFSFLILNDGKGIVWKEEYEGIKVEEQGALKDLSEIINSAGKNEEELARTEMIELTDKRYLGIATLASLKQHPRVSAFRNFILSWYLSYFTPNNARSLPFAGPQNHLNLQGDNLGNVVQFLERDHANRLKNILARIAKKIPELKNIDTEKLGDDRLLLRFYDKAFKDPFAVQQMSDGTLKIFAYLLLMEDPSPPPFICIEEPENGLYHKLLEPLASEFRAHATGRKDGSQIFITTHQPYFVNALEPTEVWILDKGENGFSTISRASNSEIVKSMVAEGLPLGGLWYSDYLEERIS